MEFKTIFLPIIIAFSLLAGYHASAFSDDTDKAQPELPLVTLMIADKKLTVEWAESRQQRYMGLSFRESLPKDFGMLFIYARERALTFTMRNTRIPLSIAFISEDLVINEIHRMDVGPDQYFDSESRAMYALEVNQGWFEENGIEPGDTIVIQ